MAYGTRITRGKTAGVAEYLPHKGIVFNVEKYPVPGPLYTSPETLVHELTHARQHAGRGTARYIAELLFHKLLTAARGQNVDTQTPFEREAYEAQERARRRQEFQQADRRQLYREQRGR